MASVLRDLGGYLATQPGFIDGYEFEGEGSLGRVSVWASRPDTDHAANQVHTIALRARLHAMTLSRQDSLSQVTGEHHAPEHTAVA